MEKREHFEGLGRCILGFTRIEADATQIFFLHPRDRMGQLMEIMEASRGGALMRLSVSFVAAALLAACAGATPEPEAPAAESARTGQVALPNTIEEDGIEVGFVDAVPEEKARLILAEALRARAAVETYFGSSLGAVRIRISNERRIPIATRGAIYLPADRIDQVTGDWTSDPMSITHEMTHLIGSGNRPDRMLIEGLAVHVNHAVGRPTYPNDGEDLDSVTLRLQAELGRTIPLVESERYRRNGSRAERRLAYTQEGSFARYYINRYGLKAFIDLVMADTAYENEPELWQRLESEWRASLVGERAESREPDAAGGIGESASILPMFPASP